MIFEELPEDELYHYGTPRHSGRYPWGSGENPYQRLDRGSFIATATRLSNEGWSDQEIAKYFFGEDASPSVYKRRLANAKADVKNDLRAQMIDLYNSGMGYSEIGRKLGKSESTVRSMLDPIKAERAQETKVLAEIISKEIGPTNFVDIGPGSENILGVTRTKMQQAVQRLVDSGEYEVQTIYIPQTAVKDANTTMQVLVPVGTPKSEVLKNLENVNPIYGVKSNDNGKTWYGIEEPSNLDSSRLKVRYNEEGGVDKDGVIELRRGVEDISLGGANYAQVRIAVDGTHYLKGMAMYSDDLPEGVDVLFNTNKHVGTPVMGGKDNTVLKVLKDDPNNPFGSLLKTEDGVVVGQRKYQDENGEWQLSPVNIVREQGDWDEWSRNLPSQFLSKQSPTLAKKQLNEQVKLKQEEFDEISALTNPEIKKKLLNEFADNCDSAAVHLKAAALPRQATKVILPLTDIGDDEIYAPSYRDGEEVILVRYPHAGTFEIPRLTVNNRNKSGEELIGNNAIDAVGINSKVAARLSGADFDGDTVVVIPTTNQKLKSSPTLRGLQDFDPKESYGKLPDGYPEVGKTRANGGDGFNTQKKMGEISNLITDMTLRNATDEELARAVRHSMVVIDAEKHQLNWKQSEEDNQIVELKNKYQAKEDPSKPGGGASTLISRAKSEERVPRRKEVTDTSKMTDEELEAWSAGKKVYRETGELDYKGHPRTITSTKMAEADDARKLSSGTLMEEIYANYANQMKSLANEARKEARSTPNSKYDPQAAKVYSEEVASLNEKLKIAETNKPYERKAQTLARTMIDSVKADNPGMDYSEVKKIESQCLNQARAITGANKKATAVTITPKEFEAIQAHAISSAKVQSILSNTDNEAFRQMATPRQTRTVSNATQTRIRSLYESGKYTLSELASQFGVSTSTVSDIIAQ